jgi:hypothetical protein
LVLREPEACERSEVWVARRTRDKERRVYCGGLGGGLGACYIA